MHSFVRLPRFRDSKDSVSPSRDVTPMDLAELTADPLDPYDPPLPRTLVHSWESGPVLVTNLTNRESTGYDLPGEGKITRTLEEGSRVWKNKTRRTYHEDVKKEKQPSVQQPASKGTTTVSVRNNATHHNSNVAANKITASSSVTNSMSRRPLGEKLYYMPRTDDDKLVSTTDSYAKKQPLRTPSPAPERRYLRDTASTAMKSAAVHHNSRNRIVRMQDKSIQCNIKKEKEPTEAVQRSFEISNDFKVIKPQKDGSVSTFSDVSELPDPGKKKDEKVVYSQVETHTPNETILTREYHEASRDKDYVFMDNHMPRGGVDRTVEVTRSRPGSRDSYSPSPTRTRVVTKSYGLNVGSDKFGPDVTPRGSPLMRSTPKPPINHWYYDQGERSRLEAESPSRARNLAQETIEETISISNASSDEMMESHKEAHKSAVRSVLNDQKVDMNANYKESIDSGSRHRVTHQPTTLVRKRDAAADALSSKSSVNSSPTGASPGMWFKSIDSDYRRHMAKNSDVRENTIGIKDHDHFCSATLSRTNKRTTPVIDSNSVQSYTLDRKHLNDRKKKAGLGYSSLDQMGGAQRRAPSLPEKDNGDAFNHTMRRYNSTKDMTTGNQSDGYRKGGLAAAFRERQDRASSLNRTIERSYHGSDFALASRFDPRPRSRSVYDSEPEVHYVPIKESSVSHIGRSHSILSSRRGEKPMSASPNGSGKSKDKVPGVHFAALSKEYSSNPAGAPSPDDKKGKKDLKRSQSIPKDTKFPWLNRFRMKVKAREP